MFHVSVVVAGGGAKCPGNVQGAIFYVPRLPLIAAAKLTSDS